MKPVLDRVTITGADDSIKPEDLVPLSKEFPFVEWGILASDNATIKSGGWQRYPSPEWIQSLQNQLWTGGVPQLSLHINGQWVRDLLLGKLTIPGWLPWLFARIQLNFHAERHPCDPPAFLRAMSLIYGRQFIFQVDGRLGNKHLAVATAAGVQRDEDIHPPFELVGLFDLSGGAGRLPESWPQPTHYEPGEQPAYFGYAGGLGPDNLAEEIPKIMEAVSEHPYSSGRVWIDMETRVRSEDDKQFDLDKVRKCLEIAAPFVG